MPRTAIPDHLATIRRTRCTDGPGSIVTSSAFPFTHRRSCHTNANARKSRRSLGLSRRAGTPTRSSAKPTESAFIHQPRSRRRLVHLLVQGQVLGRAHRSRMRHQRYHQGKLQKPHAIARLLTIDTDHPTLSTQKFHRTADPRASPFTAQFHTRS